ncbi:hypothetical protein CDCA_CDCA09G2676 [Cyanidium caldarium]|uniref:Homeobox domain-containing protein n=1 Tax=Cyanidium caldarium TaxID=2771 RepID=A0AAV9IX50_CYACA|nr:hypothetical protein CDCA_CDCA09G2676 [Cyanidium caldarium]
MESTTSLDVWEWAGVTTTACADSSIPGAHLACDRWLSGPATAPEVETDSDIEQVDDIWAWTASDTNMAEWHTTSGRSGTADLDDFTPCGGWGRWVESSAATAPPSEAEQLREQRIQEAYAHVLQVLDAHVQALETSHPECREPAQRIRELVMIECAHVCANRTPAVDAARSHQVPLSGPVAWRPPSLAVLAHPVGIPVGNVDDGASRMTSDALTRLADLVTAALRREHDDKEARARRHRWSTVSGAACCASRPRRHTSGTGAPSTASRRPDARPLKAWLFDNFLNPYPSEEDKLELMRASCLNYSQLNNWFINARVRLWRPIVEWLGTPEAT